MGCDENRMSINLAAAVFVAVSILKALKTEDLSRKLEVNYVKFQFRGGLLVPTGRVNTASRESSSKTDERIDKLADQFSTLVEIVTKKVVTPATVKAVEEICVTYGGAHAYYNCPNIFYSTKTSASREATRVFSSFYFLNK
ncbi:hypothetical protein Tco_0493617 [Tanacetum coccineum]